MIALMQFWQLMANNYKKLIVFTAAAVLLPVSGDLGGIPQLLISAPGSALASRTTLLSVTINFGRIYWELLIVNRSAQRPGISRPPTQRVWPTGPCSCHHLLRFVSDSENGGFPSHNKPAEFKCDVALTTKMIKPPHYLCTKNVG